jgi:PAS domain S-box-containing protein
MTASGDPNPGNESYEAVESQTQTQTQAVSDPLAPVPGASGKPEGGGLYRLLVDSVRDYAIFALDPTGRIISWNKGAALLKGYTANEIIGKHFSTFYPPEDVARGKPAWELEIAQSEGRFEEEGWRIRKDGSRMWANVVITALRDESGALVGFAKVTRDLTERRRAESALRLSEERFRLIVQSVKDYGIFMLDPQGHVVSWNEGARVMKRYAPEEIIGKHFSAFYPAADVARGKPAWELEVAKAEGRFEDEGWRVRKDGSLFWANVIITALRNPDGVLIGFAKVTRDLTERRAAEERTLADARRLADVEASNRTKTQFLAAMSHELRTPLNAIGGYTELLGIGVGGPVTEQQHEYLSRIEDAQHHLLGIINDLLNYSRIEAGMLTYEMGPVPLLEVVASVEAMVAPQVTMKSLTLVNGPCETDIVVRADRLKVEQVVLNVLSNAVKFTPRGGTITVQCMMEGERASITVRDTGPGIPTDKLESIFEPFVQLGRGLSTPQEGTGLGLAISRDLARAMGGDLIARSAPGQGAEFVITLKNG